MDVPCNSTSTLGAHGTISSCIGLLDSIPFLPVRLTATAMRLGAYAVSWQPILFVEFEAVAASGPKRAQVDATLHTPRLDTASRLAMNLVAPLAAS
jgi:hypothetical protein